MSDVEQGDKVRIDIPDETDPDHEYHGKHGVITEILEDDAGIETGDPKDSELFRVQLINGTEIDVRWRDLRPPFKGQ